MVTVCSNIHRRDRSQEEYYSCLWKLGNLETSWSSLTILTVSGDYLAAVARVGAGVPGWVLVSCHVLTPASGYQAASASTRLAKDIRV